jgi:hypothetical protein
MLSRLSVIKYRAYVIKYRMHKSFAMQLLLKFSLKSIVNKSNCDVHLQLKGNVYKENTNKHILSIEDKDLFYI